MRRHGVKNGELKIDIVLNGQNELGRSFDF